MKDEVGKNVEIYTEQLIAKVDQYLQLSHVSLQTIIVSIEKSYLSVGDDAEKFKKQLAQLYDLNIEYVNNVYTIYEDLSITSGNILYNVFNEPILEREDFIEKARENPFLIMIHGPYRSKYSDWTVTMFKWVQGSNPPVVAALDLDLNKIAESLLKLNQDDVMDIYILTSTGEVVASNSGIAVNTFKDLSHVKLQSEKFGWYIAVENNDLLLEKSLSKIQWVYFVLIGVSILLSILTAAVTSRYIRIPLRYLTHKINLVREGDLRIRVGMKRKDEFGILSETFDDMIGRVAQLLDDAKEASDLRRRLELQVLQAQINPHFLYNTLGSISNVVSLGKYDKVDPIISSLIRILEYGISDMNKNVTLTEELGHLHDYITIQNIRYNQNFKVYEFIEPKLYTMLVFRMLLQPIVENSIFHGYRGGRISGEIHIHAVTEDADAVVDIIDFGRGMHPEQVQNVLNSESEHGRNRPKIGLFNIHQRIQILHGKPYGLHIITSPAEGTVVRMKLPLKLQERIESKT